MCAIQGLLEVGTGQKMTSNSSPCSRGSKVFLNGKKAYLWNATNLSQVKQQTSNGEKNLCRDVERVPILLQQVWVARQLCAYKLKRISLQI